jgi:hypothetical protein
MSLLKVENFQLQNFFQTENLCRPITFHKIFFPRKIFLSGNGLLEFSVLTSITLSRLTFQQLTCNAVTMKHERNVQRRETIVVQSEITCTVIKTRYP